MKVNLDLIRNNKINFKGYLPAKSDFGEREYDFNYVYDSSKKDCYLEIFLLKQDSEGNYFVTGERNEYGDITPLQNYTTGKYDIKLKDGKATRINLAAEFGITPDQPFAYHYKLTPKGDPDGIPEYKVDAGNRIFEKNQSGKAHEVYNIITDNLPTGTKSGSMKLIIPDFYNPAWVYDNKNNIVENPDFERVKKTIKNPANKIGGNLAGVEKDLDDGKLDIFKKIIMTPLFTDDNLTAHAYWNENCMQMSQSLGNINNYARLQRKLFAKGINLVSDGAFVNEGLQGVHFRHILKWGDESPYFNWFRISGLKESPLNMGVFGKQIDHVTHRIVNPKYDFQMKSDGSYKITKHSGYKSNEPTYIQIYDDRLVNAEKLNNKKLIKAYDKLVKNNLDINNHNDTVTPYSFRIDPEQYRKNVIKLSDYNKSTDKSNRIDLHSGKGTTLVTEFKYYGIGGKHESGFETWDSNPDIAKLRFILSHTETEDLKNIISSKERDKKLEDLQRKTCEVQDYTISSANFWTEKTKNILVLNAAQKLKNINGMNSDEIYRKIKDLSNGKVFPKDLDVNKTVVQNVLKNLYNLPESNTEDVYENAILQGLMNTPLDSIELGSDIVSTLASPYITKRATSQNQIGMSRYDAYKAKNPHLMPEYAKVYELTDRMYEEEMNKFATKIIDDIDESLPANQKLCTPEGYVTPYGKYVIPLLTAEIAKFAIIKAVSPKAQFTYDKNTGEISYNYQELKDNTSLLQLGIIADCPENEAKSLVKKLSNRIDKINRKDTEELKKALMQTIKGTNENSFKLAEMIVSRAQAGLDWRIDATKDIADIGSLRNSKTHFEYTWDELIKFWSKFTKIVRKTHPDAYIAGEVTDEGEIFSDSARFTEAKDAVRKLINETGFTTIVNYSAYSSEINKIFGKLFDFDGEHSPDKGFDGNTVANQIGYFLDSAPLETILYSYVAVGNHDKCRALDGYAIDMDMFYTDLQNENNFEYRNRAFKIIKGMQFGKEPDRGQVDNYNFASISAPAIARCESISSGMGKAKNHIGVDNSRANYIYDTMLIALKHLANNSYLGKAYESEGFGSKDFPTAIDIVLDEMDYIEQDNSKKLSKSEREKLKKETLRMILDPAMSKLLGHTKFLAALTGNPTLYDGDDKGSSGYETTTKNITVQNRNRTHNEWVEKGNPDYMEFVDKFKANMEDVYKLRARKELQPLNNGAPFLLDSQNVHYKKKNYKNNFYDELDSNRPYIEGDTEMSALLRQSPNGAMTVSIFNTEGMTHKFDEYYRPAEIFMNCIDLNSKSNTRETVISGIKPGTKFRNANSNDKTVYKVNEHNQIVSPDGKPIIFQDSVLTLYSEPTFSGKRKVLYNPQYNFVSNPYSNNQKSESGTKLSLLSK